MVPSACCLLRRARNGMAGGDVSLAERVGLAFVVGPPRLGCSRSQASREEIRIAEEAELSA